MRSNTCFTAKNWQQLDWLLQMDQPILREDEAQIAADLEQLLQHEPPQYLLGMKNFMGIA